MTDRTATKQLILEAAVRCIEKYGLERVTTRKIAVAAGTNIASINYHFHSKDELIAETLSMTINHMLEDVFASIDETDEPFDKTLENVLFYLLDGSLRFPGISRAHLNNAIVLGRLNNVSTRAMTRVFDGLSKRAASAHPRSNRGYLRLRVSQIMAAAMFTMLTPHFFGVATEYRLTTSKHARALAKSYTRLFLAAI